MKNRLHKRLSAWLLTLVMLVGMLPAMASADEVGEDLAPPAPQEENYGYVRLVFAESEQLDLCHGEYITECSPTAAVYDGADEDFLTDGDYLALYYEGKLYHKAALDGVSIDAGAVLPAEDFALVPMGELAAQASPSGAEPVALTTEGTTTEPTEETTTEPAVGTTTEPTGEEQPAPEVRKAPQRAAGDDKYGYASFQFHQSGVKAIYLHSGEYINDCKGDTVPTMWPTDQYPDIQDFIRDGDYKALHYQGFLYLKGELDLHGASLNVDQMKLGLADISPKIHVREDASLYNSDSLIYSYDTGVEIYLPTGKKLALSAVRPGLGDQLYPGAIRAAGKVTITGGGTLDILYTLTGTESGTTPRTLFGLYGGEGVTLRGSENHGTGPTVNIKMDSGTFGPEANDVVGIYSGRGDLIIKDDSKVKIEMLGHGLGQTTDQEDVNWAIRVQRLELLDNASLEILSHKNVIHDIVLTAESGDVLKVDTTGFLNIRNRGDIQRYDADTWQHLKNDYPKNNIHIEGSAQGARVNIIRAEQGVKIESFSAHINDWYEKLNDPEQGNWNWAISGGTDPELGTNMYRGNRRIDNIVQVDSTTSIYTWGSMEYIYAPQGVATVKKSPGLTMDSHAPADNPHGSKLYYAKVMEPKFNDIHVVPKGGSVVLVGGEDIAKGEFLYWYDALHPTGTETGTSWTDSIKTFTNIQQDMVLVPVRDPMKTGPNLSDVDYSLQWDKGVTKQTRYAYQDLTFEKVDNISTSGGYQVMLVPAQLPRYGENTYAVKGLANNPIMNLRNSRLYADKNAHGTDGAMNGSFLNIPTGSYRIAYYDDQTNRCFISKPFTFDPPVAPPYISPDTKIEDTGGTKTVTITAERGAAIWYQQWDYTKNTWGGYIRYTEPFDVTVTADQDVRIAAYAGAPILDRRSEVRYAVRPTGKPTVKYGDTVVSDGNRRYFYDSIDLTVEAPDGYEVWYLVGYEPYESSDGGIVGTRVEDGKVTITDSGSNGILYFKLAKAFTVDGVQYRKLANLYTTVHLSKLTELPAPKVTVTPKSGGAPLTPSGNTYTMTENVVTVTLEPNGNWPLNATIAYDTNGNATPRLSTSYTKPFDVRGAGTLAVFTLVPKAGGGYEYTRTAYTFKLAESLETVPVSTYDDNCTAYYLNENGNWVSFQANTPIGYRLKVGTKVKIVPNPPSGQVFKKWEISNYEEWHIWGTYGTGDYYYNPELIFHVPKPNYNYGSSQPKILTIKATFATAAEANISGVTKVDLVMNNKVGESISLNYSNKAMRTISYQWWEGDSVGTADDVLPGAVTFDPDKTYTVKVTITANPGASFASSAGVAIGHYGGHFTVPNGKITRTNDTLTFTATPIRQIDLTMPAPLTVGEPLPTAAQVGGVPKGVTIQKLEWPYTTGTTVPDDDSVRAALTLKTDGTRPILVREYPYPTVNGVEHMYTRDSSSNEEVTNGSTVMLGSIDLPVKSKGVTVSGTIKSYGSASEAVTVTLIPASGTPLTTTVTGNSAAYSFPAVPAGEYTLKVEKKGHAPWTESITVGSADVTKNVTIYLIGDVNGDGTIDATDMQRIYAHISGENTFSNPAQGDVNGDGNVDATDMQRIYAHISGENPLS